MKNDPLEMLRLFQADLVLLRRPGAYVFLGQGGEPGGCFLHNPGYDFNDEVIPLGAGYLAAPVEESLPLQQKGTIR